jgi:hypothetical protein
VHPHQPERGSDVEAWIKRHRDAISTRANSAARTARDTLDDLLNDYRDHADCGTPLDREVHGPHVDNLT